MSPPGRLPGLVHPAPCEEWKDEAACRGMETEFFYPDRGAPTANRIKAICRTCPVKEPCLDYALANNERYGVWGGYGEAERRKIARVRRAS